MANSKITSHKVWTLIGLFIFTAYFAMSIAFLILYMNVNPGYWFTYWTTISNSAAFIYIIFKTIALFSNNEYIQKVNKSKDFAYAITAMLTLTMIVALFMLIPQDITYGKGITAEGSLPFNAYTGLNNLSNALTALIPHVLTPVFILIYWFKFTPRSTKSLKWGFITSYVVLACYAIMVLTIGFSSNLVWNGTELVSWWPYSILSDTLFGWYVIVWAASLFIIMLWILWFINIKNWKVMRKKFYTPIDQINHISK